MLKLACRSAGLQQSGKKTATVKAYRFLFNAAPPRPDLQSDMLSQK